MTRRAGAPAARQPPHPCEPTHPSELAYLCEPTAADGAGPESAPSDGTDRGEVCSNAPAPQGVDFALLDGVGPLGVAVSGGSDSTALAVLLAEAGLSNLVLLTVDHGLRKEAGADADAVAVLGRRLGLPCVRLTVRGKPKGSLQAWARTARYGLLETAAAAHGLNAVATAHTLDDQAETVLLRLARGSGVRGLSGMRPDTQLGNLRLLRPLLNVRREALRAFLRARAIPFRDDPSNADPRFARTAVRALLPELAAVGLTAERLARTAQHLARASDALAAAADALSEASCHEDRAGCLILCRPMWLAAPQDVRLRVLADVVQLAGGMPHPPRFDSLSSAAALAERGHGTTTLGRTILAVDRDRLHIWRENRDIAPLSLAPGAHGVFDGRYRVAVAADAPPVVVAPLGAAARFCPRLGHPRARLTAPGLFVDETLRCAPTLGVCALSWRRAFVTVRRLR